MASKCSGTACSPPGTPTKKRKCKDAQQPSLEKFFLSPPSRDGNAEDGISLKGDDDADALFALKLAAREAGLSISKMRRKLQAQQASSSGIHLNRPLKPLKSGKDEARPVYSIFQKADAKKEVQIAPSPRSLEEGSAGPLVGPSTPRSKAIPFDLAALDASFAQIDFTQDICVFDPFSVSTASWPRASDDVTRPTTPYALLSHVFVIISATNSRLLIVTVLTNLMRTIKVFDPASLIPAIYLITNHIAPSYEGVQLGIGGYITNKAIKLATGKSARTLKTLWDATGDPGDVAYEAKKDIKPMVMPPPLTVTKVFSSLHAIAALTRSGAGSTNAKLNQVIKLLVASRGEETRWLVRTFHSHLRIGAVKKTLSSAVARCFSLVESGHSYGVEMSNLIVGLEERKGVLVNPQKAKDRQMPQRMSVIAKLAKAERLVREVLARNPNFTSLLDALLLPAPEGGLNHLSALVPLRIGVPISPMLGSVTRSLAEVFTKLGVSTPQARAFVSEFKYDGQRIQIHATHVPDAALVDNGRLTEVAKAKRRDIDQHGTGKWVGEHGDIFVRLFSRHLEDMTSKYPDILDLVPWLMSRRTRCDDEMEKAQTSFIIDAEVVAIGNGGDSELLPFQTLSNRCRKDVDLNKVKVRVGVFAFDLMYLNGESLLKASLRLRRQLLHAHFPPMTPANPLIARFQHVKSTETNDPEEVERFFQDARAHRCEGIMVKTLDHHWQPDVNPVEPGSASNIEASLESTERQLRNLGDVVSEDFVMEKDTAEINRLSGNIKKGNKAIEQDLDLDYEGVQGRNKGVTGRGKALLSTYEPDKRCESWLKVKQDYVDGIGDSLDLVPIAAWHGMGRKAQWWSPVLLAVYDEDDDTYYAVTKCISGFTDAEYKSIKFERFPESEDPDASCYNARSQRCRHFYDTGGYFPDVWFEPREVWELRFADITLSPVYTAAKGILSEERGLSCRFPRFVRRREDKGPHQASTPGQLAKMYLNQRSRVSVSAPTGAVGDTDTGAREASEEEASEEELSEEEGRDQDSEMSG